MSDFPEEDIPQQYEQRPGSGLAVTSLVLGIAALVFFPLGIILGIGGMVCGVLGLRSPGRGYAIGGMITSGLAVVIGIGVIALAALFFTVAVDKQSTLASRAKMEADIRNIHAAAELLNVQTGSYPKSLDDLVSPIDEKGDPIPGGLDEYPTDPWGNDFRYELRDNRPVITCFGRDGMPGGVGADADFQYPEPEPGF